MSNMIAAEDLKPGDKIGRARDVVTAGPYDHGSFVSVVVRAANGEPVIRSWDRGTEVPADPAPRCEFRDGYAKHVDPHTSYRGGVSVFECRACGIVLVD